MKRELDELRSTAATDPASNDPETVRPAKRKKPSDEPKPVTKLEKYGSYSFLQDADGYVHVYTDGSCEGNGTAAACAGLGVYFGEGHAL